jgi:hypothetical protein
LGFSNKTSFCMSQEALCLVLLLWTLFWLRYDYSCCWYYSWLISWFSLPVSLTSCAKFTYL